MIITFNHYNFNSIITSSNWSISPFFDKKQLKKKLFKNPKKRSYG